MSKLADILVGELANFAGIWEWMAYIYIPTITTSGMFN